MTKNYNFFSKSNCGNTICVFNKPNAKKRSTNKKKPSLFNKKKEGINMNKNLVKVLVAGVAVGVVVAGAVVITKKVKARKARKAEEVKDEVETNEEEVEEAETNEDTIEDEKENETEETEEVAEDDTKEDVSENDEESEMEDTATEEAETENDDNDDVPVLVEIILIRVGKFVGICIGLLLGNLILRDSARLAEATKCL